MKILKQIITGRTLLVHLPPFILCPRRRGPILAVLCLIASACSLAPLAEAAPNSVALSIYPLTNSLSATTNFVALTNGLTFLGTGAVYTVTSAPFQVWPHHGFTFDSGLIGTNSANTGNVVFTFRFASLHYPAYVNGSGLMTNWTTANNLTVAAPLNGTNEQFWWTNIQPAVVDNVTLGQLISITNASTYGVNLDPTNTFIGVYP